MDVNAKVLQRLVALLADDSAAFQRMGLQSLSSISSDAALHVAFQFLTVSLLPSSANQTHPGLQSPLAAHANPTASGKAIETLLSPENHFRHAAAFLTHLVGVLKEAMQAALQRAEYCEVDTVLLGLLSSPVIRDAGPDAWLPLLPLVRRRLQAVRSPEAAAICCGVVAQLQRGLPAHEQDQFVEEVLQDLSAIPSRGHVRPLLTAALLLGALLQQPSATLRARLSDLLAAAVAVLAHFERSPLSLVAPDPETLALLLHSWQNVTKLLEMARVPAQPAVREPELGLSLTSSFRPLSASATALRLSLSLGLRPASAAGPRPTTPPPTTPRTEAAQSHRLLPSPLLCNVLRLAARYLDSALLPRPQELETDFDDEADPALPLRQLCCTCIVSTFRALWPPPAAAERALPYVTVDAATVLEAAWQALLTGDPVLRRPIAQPLVAEGVARAFLWAMEYGKAYVRGAVASATLRGEADQPLVVDTNPRHPFLMYLTSTSLDTLQCLDALIGQTTDVPTLGLWCAALAAFLFHLSFCSLTTELRAFLLGPLPATLARRLRAVTPNLHQAPHRRGLRGLLCALCAVLDDRLLPLNPSPSFEKWSAACADQPTEPEHVTVLALADGLLAALQGPGGPEVQRAAFLAGALLARRYRVLLAMYDRWDTWFLSLLKVVEASTDPEVIQVGIAALVDVVVQPNPMLGPDALAAFHAAFPKWLAKRGTQLSALAQVMALTAAAVPGSLLGTLAGDIIALVVAARDGEEFQQRQPWSSALTQSVSLARFGIEVSAEQPNSSMAAPRTLPPELESLQALSQSSPRPPRPTSPPPSFPLAPPMLCISPRAKASRVAPPPCTLRKSGYLPLTLSVGGLPPPPSSLEDRHRLAAGCLVALRHLVGLRVPAAFSTLQLTQMLHFATQFLLPMEPALAALASELVRGVVGLHDAVNWAKVVQPLVLRVLPAMSNLLASGVVGEDRQLEAALVRLYSALALAARQDAVGPSAVAKEYQSLVAALGDAPAQQCVVFDVTVVANSALLASHASLPCRCQQPPPDEVALLHGTPGYVERRPEVLQPVARCLAALLLPDRPQRYSAPSVSLDDAEGDEEGLAEAVPPPPPARPAAAALPPQAQALLSWLVDAVLLFPQPGRPPPETSGLWLGLHSLTELAAHVDLLGLFPDRSLYKCLSAYFAVSHDTLPVLAAQVLGRCCAQDATGAALEALLADRHRSRRHSRALLTALYHAATPATAAAVARRCATALLAVARNAAADYAEDEAQLATALLARFAVLDTRETFHCTLRPLAGPAAPHPDRRLLLAVLEALFEDDGQVLPYVDTAVFRVHANSILTTFLSPRQPLPLQRQAVVLLSLACQRQTRIAFYALELGPLLSRMAQMYVARTIIEEDADFRQAALDKTALKEAILDHIVGLRQATVEPLTAPDGAMVGHSGLSLLHLIPEQDLSRLYSAITAAARDSAPPPDSALRREALQLLQTRLGIVDV